MSSIVVEMPGRELCRQSEALRAVCGAECMEARLVFLTMLDARSYDAASDLHEIQEFQKHALDLR